jgi:putative restriction endonuclease
MLDQPFALALSFLTPAIASRILEQHFPESLHPDILNAVGLSLETTVTRRKRDPAFRQRVLKAYEYRCAVCGFDVRLGSVSIALDAAHIRWHQAGGPARMETPSNRLIEYDSAIYVLFRPR